MKAILRTALATVILVVVVVALKKAQKACWDKKVSFISPPSLSSWDPTERAEAARQAGKKFGGAP